jgi:hypothetical protein
VAKGSVIHASHARLWKRWQEYRARAGDGKALKWLARNVLEMAYDVWEHRVPCDQTAHFGIGKTAPQPPAIAAPAEPVLAGEGTAPSAQSASQSAGDRGSAKLQVNA